MKNQALKAEADLLIQSCGLRELLSNYERWFVGGSYSYDLMCWRDLDVYILDRQADLKQCFEVGYELTRRLGAKKARFTNNVSSAPRANEPSGFYWGIKLGDERQGAWKLDVWFLDLPAFEEHENYGAQMRRRLTAETARVIREIKEAFWRRPEYRDTITSDLIYRAVLDHGALSKADFERLLAVAAEWR